MKVLIRNVKSEFSVKGSRFVSELFPCSSQNDAKNIVKAQKQKYSDATHVVHAFVLGFKKEILGTSDDGEPSGTAGRPALDVLKSFDCTNVLLTITRWFGGTLLGTGGLVKAYGDSAKQVLSLAQSEGAFEEYIEKKDFVFSVDYSLYKTIKHFFESFNIYDLNEQFEQNVKISGKIKASEYEIFKQKLKDISCGKIIVN